MKTEKKSWVAPLMLNIDGSRVKSGVVPLAEGSHVTGTLTGSWALPS
jgi:hypothetical protein